MKANVMKIERKKTDLRDPWGLPTGMWGVVRGGSAVTELAALGRDSEGLEGRGRGAGEEDLQSPGCLSTGCLGNPAGFQHLRVLPPPCWLNTTVG